MKNKNLSIVMLTVACVLSLHANAQLEVASSGDVTLTKNLEVGKDVEIGQNLTISNDVAIGIANIDDHMSINLSKTTGMGTTPYYGIKSYMKMSPSMPTSPLYGVHSIVDASFCSEMTGRYPMVGVYGQAKKTYSFPSVFAAGIAGLTHPYGGIAVYGGVDYSFNLPTSMPNGCYAGYFNGAVNINGTLTATAISIPGNRNQLEHSETIAITSSENLRLLNPIIYTLKPDSAWIHDMDAKKLQGSHYGLIAQDVQKIYPELVYGTGENLSINYIELIPLLIKAVQELSMEVEYLKNTQASKAPSYSPASQDNGVKRAALYQNIPNPFNQNTKIGYILPEDTHDASIHIYDMSGAEVAVFLIDTFGQGELTINGGTLRAGMYLYALIADEQLIDTKQMILTK